MRTITPSATDEVTYAWFVEVLATFGGAVEVEADLIQVDLDDGISEEEWGDFDEVGFTPVLVSISRTDLRLYLDTRGWSASAVQDDLGPLLDTAGRDDRFVVFHAGALRKSVRRELPPRTRLRRVER
ncbi:hypothetical protein [Mumia sp. DW29H23]|uniref:hypothetical protein n=1 Tax=Mumia sp. DW29H23 TaxID=3421241 RepID=UPI003D6876C5